MHSVEEPDAQVVGETRCDEREGSGSRSRAPTGGRRPHQRGRQEPGDPEIGHPTQRAADQVSGPGKKAESNTRHECLRPPGPCSRLVRFPVSGVSLHAIDDGGCSSERGEDDVRIEQHTSL